MSTEKARESPLLSVKATENSTARTEAPASDQIAPRLDTLLDELNRATNKVAQWRFVADTVPSLHVLQAKKRDARKAIGEFFIESHAASLPRFTRHDVFVLRAYADGESCKCRYHGGGIASVADRIESILPKTEE